MNASGNAYLAQDTLVFDADGLKPMATSIFVQGTTSPSGGVVFGQGISCVGGSLRRMYVTNASAGNISAPNFGAGDLSVSARSASLGDVIAAGQSRYYAVFYRDAIVLGGCSPTSTFNVTQTGRVTWWP